MNKKTLKLFITSLPILSLGHVALAGSVGNDFQKLSPIGSSIDYTVIEPSATIKSGKLNSGILVDYSTNVLPVIESEQELQSIGSINDSILSSHIFASYGLMKNTEIGIYMPTILTNSSDSNAYQGDILSSGFSYIGAFAKYKIWSNSKYGLALGTHLGTDLMASNPYIGDASPVYLTTYAAADAKFSKLKLAVNAGYKYRSTGDAILDETTGESPIEPIASEFIYGAASNFKISKKRLITAELFGTIGLGSGLDNSDRSSASMELLSSYKQSLNNKLSVTAGAGTEILHGVGSADLRFFAGISLKTDVPSFGRKTRGKTKVAKKNPARKSSAYQDDYFYKDDNFESYEPIKNEETSNEKIETYNFEVTDLPSFDGPSDFTLE